MEYAARKDGRINESTFLQIDPRVLDKNGVLFTDDVSNKAGVQIYTLDQAADIIDFEVLHTTPNWSDEEFKKRIRKVEKCEILVPDFVSIDLIRNL